MAIENSFEESESGFASFGLWFHNDSDNVVTIVNVIT